MGLPMNNIHYPTVPSGPTSNLTTSDGPGETASLTDLIAAKERVEGEMTALSQVLASHNVNMNTSLTTFDGYPRDDLDIAQIRTTRARIIRLRNDYKALMSRIEKGLHEYHATAKANGSAAPLPQPTLPQTNLDGPSVAGSPRPAFAKVNGVVPGSPAEQSGLQAGDLISRFGNVNKSNHEDLRKVAETVQRNEGKNILVEVQRGGALEDTEQTLDLILTPRSNWGGRGLLGCHLLQL